jgi:LysM repeat protein
LAESNTDPQVQNAKYYVVKEGDTLYQISSKTGITISELRMLNGLDANDPIIPGQKLMIK